jgi:hypothetical protein
MDGQSIAAMTIVVAAAVVVGQRLYKQIRGFGADDDAGCSSGCSGCGCHSASGKRSETPLIKIELDASQRFRRPEAKP